TLRKVEIRPIFSDLRIGAIRQHSIRADGPAEARNRDHDRVGCGNGFGWVVSLAQPFRAGKRGASEMAGGGFSPSVRALALDPLPPQQRAKALKNPRAPPLSPALKGWANEKHPKQLRHPSSEERGVRRNTAFLLTPHSSLSSAGGRIRSRENA